VAKEKKENQPHKYLEGKYERKSLF